VQGQGKLTALLSANVNILSANVNVLSAFCRSLPAGNTLTSHWDRKQKHANITMGRKVESGAERLLQKAESRGVDLPRPDSAHPSLLQT